MMFSSNLPLIIVGGQMRHLDDLSEDELERFIPFVLDCMREPGHFMKRPQWWLEDVAFTIPLEKNQDVAHKWRYLLKCLVMRCYQDRKSTSLISLCNHLSTYPPDSLEKKPLDRDFVALHVRRTGLHLVTVKKSNYTYDRTEVRAPRKYTLLPHKAVAQRPAPVDVYLCDYCDTELDTLPAIQEHERLAHDTQREQSKNVSLTEKKQKVTYQIEREQIYRDLIERFYHNNQPTTPQEVPIDQLAVEKSQFLQHFELCTDPPPVAPPPALPPAPARIRYDSCKGVSPLRGIPLSCELGVALRLRQKRPPFSPMMKALEKVDRFCLPSNVPIVRPPWHTIKHLMQKYKSIHLYSFTRREKWKQARDLEDSYRQKFARPPPKEVSPTAIAKEVDYIAKLLTPQIITSDIPIIDLCSDDES